jgi:3D (Asp-Asp-Asp) domain-containing protein
MKIIISLVLSLMFCLTVQAGIQSASSKSLFSKSLQPNEGPVSANGGRLACLTAYWPGEDHYTNRRLSATGERLHDGCCAVDSRIIPYGSVVEITGVGSYIAVDTGTAVIARKAARESGHNSQERSALVIDLYFVSRKAGELFSREGPKFAMVAWQTRG